MKKLLYITNGINGPGGLERVLAIKASYLADHYGYQVTILSLNDSDQDPFYEFSNNIQMKSIPVGGNLLRYVFSYIKGIKRVVKEVNPDVICVCDDGLKAFILPMLLGKKTPLIYERHVSKRIDKKASDRFFTTLHTNIKWFLMEVLGNSFHKFVVLTKGNVSEWQRLKNVRVIPNPLSFYPKESSTLTNKKVLAVGKQGYQKAYDLLLHAWHQIHQEFPQWQLEIYGTYDATTNLTQLAKELQLETSVAFYKPIKNIVEKYLECSLYVMSSRFEGFGMVLIEAMACGVPCVAFDCPHGPADIISHKEDGLLVPNGNIEQLAISMKTLLADEEERKRLGAKAKQNVKRYEPKHIVQQWDTLFKEMLP